MPVAFAEPCAVRSSVGSEKQRKSPAALFGLGPVTYAGGAKETQNDWDAGGRDDSHFPPTSKERIAESALLPFHCNSTSERDREKKEKKKGGDTSSGKKTWKRRKKEKKASVRKVVD